MCEDHFSLSSLITDIKAFCLLYITGLFLTPMLLKARPEPSQQESAAKIIPFPKRIADPADFAQLVQAIMENKMINGEIIRIDGAVRMP